MLVLPTSRRIASGSGAVFGCEVLKSYVVRRTESERGILAPDLRRTKPKVSHSGLGWAALSP